MRSYLEFIFLLISSVVIMFATKNFIYCLLSLLLQLIILKKGYFKKDIKSINIIEYIISVFISASFIDFTSISNNIFLRSLLFLLFSVSIFYLINGLVNCLAFTSFGSKNFNNSSLKESLIYFIILLFSWLLYFVSLFPGLLSSDSIDQWRQGYGLNPYSNVHPMLHTLLIKLSGKLVSSPWLFVLFQIVFSAMIIAIFISKLGYFGINKKIRYLISLFIGIFPLNGFYMCVLWKDIPFAISFLFLLGVYSKGKLIFKKFNMFFIFILFSFLSMEFRKNALLVIPIIILLLCFRIKKKYFIKCLLSCVFSLLLVLSFDTFVTKKYHVISSHSSEGMGILLQQIAAAEKFRSCFHRHFKTFLKERICEKFDTLFQHKKPIFHNL